MIRLFVSRPFVFCLTVCVPFLAYAAGPVYPAAAAEKHIGYAEEKDSGIRIETDVPDTEVYIDGLLQGTAPFSDCRMQPGLYHIRLEKQGYETRMFSVYVETGSVRTYKIQMTPLLGYVSFKVSPPDAEILIDGRACSLHEELPEGNYSVKFRSFGYETEIRQVAVRRYATTVVDVSMEKAALSVSSFRSDPKRFNPDNPGPLGKCSFTFSVTAPAEGRITIMRGGRTVRTFDLSRFTTWTQTVMWDGRDNFGNAAEDGVYDIFLDVFPPDGSAADTLFHLRDWAQIDTSIHYPLVPLFPSEGGTARAQNARLLPSGSFALSFAASPLFRASPGGGYGGVPLMIALYGSPADWFEYGISGGLTLSGTGDAALSGQVSVFLKTGFSFPLVSVSAAVRYGYSSRAIAPAGRADMGQGLGFSVAAGIRPAGWYLGLSSDCVWGTERGFPNDGSFIWKNTFRIEYERDGFGGGLWVSAHSFFDEGKPDWLSALTFGVSASVLTGRIPCVISPGVRCALLPEGVYIAPSVMCSILF